jgi:hypothetical protein
MMKRAKAAELAAAKSNPNALRITEKPGGRVSG